MSDPRSVKILLLQVRKNPEAMIAERQNFLLHSGLKDKSLSSLDVYRHPDYDPEILLDYDGFFVGGLSDDPSDDVSIDPSIFPFLPSFNLMLGLAGNKKIPGLLSCGGFMLACKYWGGTIVIDKKRSEMGVYKLHLSRERTQDILLKGFANSINIVSGHLKSTLETPPDCLLFGSTERCRVHVIRRKYEPIYAFQGHPEITTSDLLVRVSPYKAKYFRDDHSFQKFTSLEADTSAINSILRKFVDLIAQGQFS